MNKPELINYIKENQYLIITCSWIYFLVWTFWMYREELFGKSPEKSKEEKERRKKKIVCLAFFYCIFETWSIIYLGNMVLPIEPPSVI